ncbi:MAG: imidazole glycerol phosphate synthase subunit HisH [Kiritimatiellae bacterium]|nr:imidazole glycerol phosphate synthase subunit HisH [Kiritimatiellia bacterium]
MITILDYGAGNLTSVRLAFERLGVTPQIITDAAAYQGGRILFPGVGSAASGMDGICNRGFDRLLRDAVAQHGPVMGICLGMQLLLTSSEEDGGVQGLNLIPGACTHFDRQKDPTAKIPHMGWNTLQHQAHPILYNVPQDSAFYFVHSYFVTPANPTDVLGTTEYCGERFAAVIGHGSLIATQFHPERSGEAGAKLLENFLTWEGVCS